MNIPGNGIYVVQGEIVALLTAMKKVNRWSSHSHQDEENDILVRGFATLKDDLNTIGDLRQLEPTRFLAPFLEVIRSEETSGPVTSLALSSVNKFLTYNLIDPNCKTISSTVQNISDAVTHAKFVGTDTTSDSLVLMKIIQVLRTLILSPVGAWLTDESVCEILFSCFKMSTERAIADSDVAGPYGLVMVCELLRFSASLCNPLEKNSSDAMIHIGLALITVAFEVGADSIAKFPSLMAIVKNDVCRNLFALMSSERLPVFSGVLQAAFLMFESLRTHLKFQLEHYLGKLSDIIVSDSQKISYEHREVALESLVQMWRIPGLVTELYLNYDCALYCPNLYEDLTNLLSKNAFPVSGIFNTHLLSLDALLTVIDSIESHCNSRILNERNGTGNFLQRIHSRSNIFVIVDYQGVPSLADGNASETVEHSSNYIQRTGTRQPISAQIPTHEELMAVKRKKKLLATGTEHFNSKPKKGIQFLQEHHLLSSPLDPKEVVHFLRENPHLDKKMIGEYISNRANLTVLDSFVKSFNFTGKRIDEALRLYLETFRLPGESPLISLVMEHFAEHWHKCNNDPFANPDAAFTLAYAVIMLNVDQHNNNAKKQNIPMTADDFKRNLKNVNGGQDFDEEMLNEIYNSIKNEEIVMPAEQVGIVKENYLWNVLLRRGASDDGIYIHCPNGLLDHDLFSLIWSPAVAALSTLFDKAKEQAIYLKAISGFRKNSQKRSQLMYLEHFRDRITTMWSDIREHIYTLLMGATACDHHFLVERSVVGLLRLAIRLMHREEMSPMVLQSLRMLLLLKGVTLTRVSRQVSYGMYELLKTSAANIHSATDWVIIFTLLECVGAGAPPPRVVSKPLNYNESGARSEGEVQPDSGLGNERGYTSDSELSKAGSLPISPSNSAETPLSTPTGWILLLDLIHTLHTRTAQIFKWWAEETNETDPISLWPSAWCPLLQGIARLSAHPNRQVRMSAITYLQRALLVPDLQTLTGAEWESCFTLVLFPLLARLLEPGVPLDGLEETRIRAATVLSKVFLHHLTPLQTLPSFAQLWLTILDFMDRYMHADNSDLLLEAVPETLKNLLLVMDSAGVFNGQDGRNEVWVVTWDRINSFLPKLHGEIFKSSTAMEKVFSEAQFRFSILGRSQYFHLLCKYGSKNQLRD
ncbi:unnamed protein product [Nesidiocoris tenuis]|uniref:SEC7 domain-containing protein n=1 Tax=Nesidiocoris tenuis TaxID=355587 RepID=A0A6H5GQR0_9HEMI|nr:unnamed protein product [Nesidiocoris tenuis]